MSIPTKEMIQQACRTFNQNKILKEESKGKITKICMINDVFMNEFGPGHYFKSFIILKNHFRVLYFGEFNDYGLRVEECPPPDTKNHNTRHLFSNSIYMSLSDFLWTFWPEGIYHIEKFLMDKE